MRYSKVDHPAEVAFCEQEEKDVALESEKHPESCPNLILVRTAPVHPTSLDMLLTDVAKRVEVYEPLQSSLFISLLDYETTGTSPPVSTYTFSKNNNARRSFES